MLRPCAAVFWMYTKTLLALVVTYADEGLFIQSQEMPLTMTYLSRMTFFRSLYSMQKENICTIVTALDIAWASCRNIRKETSIFVFYSPCGCLNGVVGFAPYLFCFTQGWISILKSGKGSPKIVMCAVWARSAVDNALTPKALNYRILNRKFPRRAKRSQKPTCVVGKTYESPQ